MVYVRNITHSKNYAYGKSLVRVPNHDDVMKWKHFPRYWLFFAGNSPVTGEFPSQRPVTRNFDVFFDLRLNKWLNKQSWGWWFETPSRPLRRHCNDKRWPIAPLWAMRRLYCEYFLKIMITRCGDAYCCYIICLQMTMMCDEKSCYLTKYVCAIIIFLFTHRQMYHKLWDTTDHADK